MRRHDDHRRMTPGDERKPRLPTTGRREFLALGVGALAVGALPAALRGRARLVRRRIPVMGTVAEVAIPTRNEAWAQRAIDAAFAELRRVDATMSRFRPDSDVGRLNSAPSRRVWVSGDTGSVLECALEWAERSLGRFDPCLGGASEFWDVANRVTPPGDESLRGYVDAHLWRALEVGRGSGGTWARLNSPLARLDLGGIAKGYGVDLAAEALQSFGVTDGLVNVGGDLVALGADAAGEPWVVGVRSPDDPRGLAATLGVTDAAVATSGDYLQYFEHGGARYHHLLDPATGAPRRTATRSVTVQAARCIDADAAATTAFCTPSAHRGALLSDAHAQLIHQVTEVTT